MPNDNNLQVPAERRPPAGLAIFSTEPLSANERDVLRGLVRLHSLAIDLLNEAISRGRVVGALEALEMCGTFAMSLEQAKVRTGCNR
jgi:hypothetical protein